MRHKRKFICGTAAAEAVIQTDATFSESALC